jgi:hypothetical protein
MVCLYPANMVEEHRIPSQLFTFLRSEPVLVVGTGALVMETLTNLFDRINDLLGVSSGAELATHPIFVGFCVLVFIYAWISGQKIVALGLFGLLAGSASYYYLYPKGSSVQLYDLLVFLAVMGAIALIIIYFGFIRE